MVESPNHFFGEGHRFAAGMPYQGIDVLSSDDELFWSASGVQVHCPDDVSFDVLEKHFWLFLDNNSEVGDNFGGIDVFM